MIWKQNKEKNAKLEEAKDQALDALLNYSAEDEEYHYILDSMERLRELDTPKRNGKASPDTKWMVLGNFGIVGFMIIYEQKHVIVSKATGFLMKLK
jgi:hypothetical protein